MSSPEVRFCKVKSLLRSQRIACNNTDIPVTHQRARRVFGSDEIGRRNCRDSFDWLKDLLDIPPFSSPGAILGWQKRCQEADCTAKAKHPRQDGARLDRSTRKHSNQGLWEAAFQFFSSGVTLMSTFTLTNQIENCLLNGESNRDLYR